MTSPAPPTYHDRYCAFVDILGFSVLVEQLRHGTTSSETIRDLLRIIHEPAGGESAERFAESDLRAQSISDAVCISTACTAAGLLHLFHVLQELSLRLLARGFFIRGAIVKGELYHDDTMVFGEALIRAYRLEQEVVRYPRIMIVSGVAADRDALIKQGLYGGEFFLPVTQAADGPRFLDVLSEIETEMVVVDTDEERRRLVDHFDKLADQIQRRFDEAFDNPRHFEKVQWFAKYWNRVASRFQLKRVEGSGLDDRPIIWA